MPDNELSFEDFLNDVDPRYQEFVRELHGYMLENGCKFKLALAKNGYVASYSYGKPARVVLNFVFRKSGLVARIYGDNVNGYLDFIEALPEALMSVIEKAPACKRFENPPKCSSKCVGYVFAIKGTQYQKCKYNCFMFSVDDESIPFIREFIENELKARRA